MLFFFSETETRERALTAKFIEYQAFVKRNDSCVLEYLTVSRKWNN